MEEEAVLGHLPLGIRGGVWLSSGLLAERNLDLRAGPGKLEAWPWVLALAGRAWLDPEGPSALG